MAAEDSSSGSILDMFGFGGCGPEDRACAGDRPKAIERMGKEDARCLSKQLTTLMEAISQLETRISTGDFCSVDVARLLEFHSRGAAIAERLGKDALLARLLHNVLRIASTAYSPQSYRELETVLTADPLCIEVVRHAELRLGSTAAEEATRRWGSKAHTHIGDRPHTVFEAAREAEAQAEAAAAVSRALEATARGHEA